jgi:hypothetical protein
MQLPIHQHHHTKHPPHSTMALTRAKMRNDMAIAHLEFVDITMSNMPESEAETTGNTNRALVRTFTFHRIFESDDSQRDDPDVLDAFAAFESST